jgi:hypothetical protein
MTPAFQFGRRIATRHKGASFGQTVTDMSNNAARVGGGVLSGLAGGIGTVGTGLAAGATNAWNAVTPKSMNTSQGWSQGVNNVFNKTVDFTNAGVKDVVGGLGGDTNYAAQHSWDKMQAGLNDPNVDPTSKNIASAAGWAGHGAWNLGTSTANPGKMLAGVGGAAARIGSTANRLDDFVQGPLELGNSAYQFGKGVYDGINAPQQ